jgi:nitrate reductase delta subunit
MLKLKKSAAHREALRQVKSWTRERFALHDDAVISVSEVACALPGCPPVETIVVFWTAAETRHHFKVFKPVEEVVEDDLPPAWMKNALIAMDGCDCC